MSSMALLMILIQLKTQGVESWLSMALLMTIMQLEALVMKAMLLDGVIGDPIGFCGGKMVTGGVLGIDIGDNMG